MTKLFEIMEKIRRLAENMDTEKELFSKLEKELMLRYIQEMYEQVSYFTVGSGNGDGKDEDHISGSSLVDQEDLSNIEREVKSNIQTTPQIKNDPDQIDPEEKEIILDLNKKIGFINHLFAGNSANFEKTLQIAINCASPDKAQNTIEDQMKASPSWNIHSDTVAEFIKYIRQIAMSNKMQVAK